MANTKPLKLKRQKTQISPSRNISIGAKKLQAEVLLDSGVFHLEQEFSYFVPDNLAGKIAMGSIVRVPFKNEFKLGVVVKLSELNKTNLLGIDQVVFKDGLSPSHFAFAQAVANRYVANYPEVLSSMYSGIGGKGVTQESKNFDMETRNAAVNREFLQISDKEGLRREISTIIENHKSGSLLILFPSLHAMRALFGMEMMLAKREVIQYGSHLSASQRKKALNDILNGSSIIVVGLRGAVFAPIKDLAHIVVVDEFSSNYHEQRRPYWNVRDVALLRHEHEGCDVSFVGSSCSLELWRLVENGWIKHRKLPASSKRMIHQAVCYPDTYHSTIREGLKLGPVLVCVAGKDYASGFVCANCRNRARCKCGAFLHLTEKNTAACSVCDFLSSSWSCSECGATRTLVFRSGAKKLIEELGKAFPGERLIINTVEKPFSAPIDKRFIVISTYGIEPEIDSGYGAVVLLDGEFLTSRRFYRAEEETFNLWHSSMSLLQTRGRLYLSLLEKHPIAQSLIAGRVALYLNSALRDRVEAQTPPATRIVRVSGDARDLSGLRSKIKNQFENHVEVYLSRFGTELTVKTEHESAAQLLSALKALQKLRTASKKSLLEIQVDPYAF